MLWAFLAIFGAKRSQAILGDNPASASQSFNWAGLIYICCKVLLDLKYCTWINYTSIAVSNQIYTKIIHNCPPSAANTMLGICYLLLLYVVAHMGAVLWSVMLHAVLYTTQPLQPLHSPAPDWSHTSWHNNNQTY